MRGYIVFTKKELLEQLRTFKGLMLLSVYFLLGMMNPVLAKLTPDIIASMPMEGMQIVIPEPTVMDAYVQFFKNFPLFGILVLLLIFGGTLSNELVRGTMVNILAKGLPRSAVILSKYTAAVLLWTLGYVLAAITTYGYTAYLFHEANVSNLLFSLFCLWMFGCLILALIFLSSTVTSGSFGGLILTAISIVIMMMLDIMPITHRYNPIALASDNTALLTGAQEVDQLIITVIITGILTVSCLAASIFLFAKKKL